MASLKDISAACGVSVATVSKALNDHRDVGEETKQHIREVAKKMGYFPNANARALRTNRSNSIGVLFVDEMPQSGLTHDYFSHILDSFKITVEAQGYDVTFINCNKGRKNNMSYLEHCKYRNVDGVLIACVDFSDKEIRELVESDIPVVTIDYVFNNRLAVSSDNVKGIRDLLTYVYEQGHRKIAYVYGHSSAVTDARIKSFYKTASELGLDVNEDYLIKGSYRDAQGAEKLTAKLLDMKERPTCIIYPDDLCAMGGRNEIRSRGLRIPEDISIAGYDGISITQQIEPQITTIYQDTRMIGRVAAENLINLIEKPKSSLIEHVVVEGNLIRGRSVRKMEV